MCVDDVVDFVWFLFILFGVVIFDCMFRQSSLDHFHYNPFSVKHLMRKSILQVQYALWRNPVKKLVSILGLCPE